MEPTNIDAWASEHKASFSPPVCNKLMHKGQLSIMFVGGPNSRTDFHIEQGSELFFQLRGGMELPTIQAGKLKLVKIPEGHFFVLPPRIPHSPQRPEENSLGLVIERARVTGEMDAMRWYTDFATCNELLYERWFRCEDLARDLPPIVKAFKASHETESSVPTERPFADEITFSQALLRCFPIWFPPTEVPEPILFSAFVAEHLAALSRGETIDVLAALRHPDREFSVRLVGGPSTQVVSPASSGPRDALLETFYYQLEGDAARVIIRGAAPAQVGKGSCLVVSGEKAHEVSRPAGSVGLVIQQHPAGRPIS